MITYNKGGWHVIMLSCYHIKNFLNWLNQRILILRNSGKCLHQGQFTDLKTDQKYQFI